MLRAFKREHPAAQLVMEASEEVSNTPDMWYLDQFATHKVFIYDELKRNHRQHFLMDTDSKFEGEAFTWLPYSMWKRPLGQNTYPILLRNAVEGAPHLRVHGELYSVTPKMLSSLDKLRGNEVNFKRKPTLIRYVYRSVMWGPEGSYLSEEKSVNVTAWVYVAKDSYWRPQIETNRLYFERLKDGNLFEPVRSFQPKNCTEPYYSFTPLEYKDAWEHPSVTERKPPSFRDIPLLGKSQLTAQR